jgi:glycosyltransferase involved in cell wall biosynthesis
VTHEGSPHRSWRFLGHQTDETLVYLYRRAVALLFPSKNEGFGLPVVEAQALGCPVICSRVASLPEVGGDAAFYSEMTPAAYLEAMLRLMRDGPLRQELVEKGKTHSAKFSWSKCARETVEVYRHANKA